MQNVRNHEAVHTHTHTHTSYNLKEKEGNIRTHETYMFLNIQVSCVLLLSKNIRGSDIKK